jgi:hypothetical protein
MANTNWVCLRHTPRSSSAAFIHKRVFISEIWQICLSLGLSTLWGGNWCKTKDLSIPWSCITTRDCNTLEILITPQRHWVQQSKMRNKICVIERFVNILHLSFNSCKGHWHKAFSTLEKNASSVARLVRNKCVCYSFNKWP